MANPELPEQSVIMGKDRLKVIHPTRGITFTITFGPNNTVTTIPAITSPEDREKAAKDLLSEASRRLIDIGSRQNIASMPDGAADLSLIGQETPWQTDFKNAIKVLAEMGHPARRLQELIRDQSKFFPETAHIGYPTPIAIEQVGLLNKQVEDIYREMEEKPQEQK